MPKGRGTLLPRCTHSRVLLLQGQDERLQAQAGERQVGRRLLELRAAWARPAIIIRPASVGQWWLLSSCCASAHAACGLRCAAAIAGAPVAQRGPALGLPRVGPGRPGLQPHCVPQHNGCVRLALLLAGGAPGRARQFIMPHCGTTPAGIEASAAAPRASRSTLASRWAHPRWPPGALHAPR